MPRKSISILKLSVHEDQNISNKRQKKRVSFHNVKRVRLINNLCRSIEGAELGIDRDVSLSSEESSKTNVNESFKLELNTGLSETNFTMPNNKAVSNSESKKTDIAKPRFSLLDLTIQESFQCPQNIENKASFTKNDDKENYPQMDSISENRNVISLDQSSFHIQNNNLDDNENSIMNPAKSYVKNNNLNMSMWSMNESTSNVSVLEESLILKDYNQNDNILFKDAYDEVTHNDFVKFNINNSLSKEMSYDTKLFSFKKDISEDKYTECTKYFDRNLDCQNIDNSIISGINGLSSEPIFIYNSEKEDQPRYEDVVDNSEKGNRVSIDMPFERTEFQNQFSALDISVIQKDHASIEKGDDLKNHDLDKSSIIFDNKVLENKEIEKTNEKDEIFLFGDYHTPNKNIFENQSQQIAFYEHFNDVSNNNSVSIDNFYSNETKNVDEFLNISSIFCKNASADRSNGKCIEKTDSVATGISSIDINQDLSDKNSFFSKNVSLDNLNFNNSSNIKFVNNANLNKTPVKDFSNKNYEYDLDNASNYFENSSMTNESNQRYFQISLNTSQVQDSPLLNDSLSSKRSDCLSASFDFKRNATINADISVQANDIASNETLYNKSTISPRTGVLNVQKQNNSINHSDLPLQSSVHFKPSGTNFPCQSFNSNNNISKISQKAIEYDFMDNLSDMKEDESYEENDLNKAIYFDGDDSLSAVLDNINQSRVNDDKKIDLDTSDDSSNLNDVLQRLRYGNSSKSKKKLLSLNNDNLMDTNNSEMDNNCNDSEQRNELIQDQSIEVCNDRDNMTSNTNTTTPIKESSKIPSKYFEGVGNTDGSIFINLSDISKHVNNKEYLKTDLSITSREDFSNSSIESEHIPFNNFDDIKITEDENDITIENNRNNSLKLHGNSQINLTTPMILSTENIDINFSKSQKEDLDQSSFTTNSSFKFCHDLIPSDIFSNSPKHIFQSQVSNFETPINRFNSHVYHSTVRNTNNFSKKPRLTDVLSTPSIDSLLSSRIQSSSAKFTKPKANYYSIDRILPPQKSELRSFDINAINDNCKSLLSGLGSNVVPKSKNKILKPKKRETFSNIHPEIAKLYVTHIGIPRLKLMHFHQMKLDGLTEKLNLHMNRIYSFKSKLLIKCTFCSNHLLCPHYNKLKEVIDDVATYIYGEYKAIMQSFRFRNDIIRTHGANRIRSELRKINSRNEEIIQEHNRLKFQKENDQEISKMRNEIKSALKLFSQYSKFVDLDSKRKYSRLSDKSEEERLKERYEFIIRKKISPLQEQIISPRVIDFMLMGSRVTIRSLIRSKDNEIFIESATVTVNETLFPMNNDIQNYFQALVNDSVVNCSKAQAKEIFWNSQEPILLLYGDVKLCSKFRKLTFYSVPDKPFVLKAQIISIGSMLIRFAIIFDLNPINTYQNRPLNYHVHVEFDNVDVQKIKKVIEETENGLNKLYRLFDRLFLELPDICLDP